MTETEEPTPQRRLLNNWISYFGFLLAVVFLIGEAILIGMDLIQPSHNPYAGILIYLVGPSILVFGLLLVPIGLVYESRYRRRHGGESSLPVIDFNLREHRRKLGIFVVVSAAFVLLSLAGTYKAYHLTESVQFCGKLCHEVMTPEYVAYQHSPHARVGCTECHIGPGADWFVKSKLSGAYQVYAVLADSYTLPIDTPIKDLRPARETCEQCHWPAKFEGNTERVRPHYASDEENTPYQVILSLKVGGGHPEHGHVGGIHWHVSPLHQVEYIAADEERMEIPYVRVVYQNGQIEEFKGAGIEDLGEIKENDPRLRIMDCVDCHNRPSHIFRSPSHEVNQAIYLGQIDPDLPNIKGEAVSVLQEDYASQEEAVESIETELQQAYADTIQSASDLAPLLETAVERVQTIYRLNIFPQWKVSWDKYPDHSGHFRFLGCYRCHDDQHETEDGKTVSNECTLCHTVIGQAEGWDELKDMEIEKQPFRHPRGLEGAEQAGNCSDCHGV